MRNANEFAVLFQGLELKVDEGGNITSKRVEGITQAGMMLHEAAHLADKQNDRNTHMQFRVVHQSSQSYKQYL